MRILKILGIALVFGSIVVLTLLVGNQQAQLNAMWKMWDQQSQINMKFYNDIKASNDSTIKIQLPDGATMVEPTDETLYR